MKISYADLEWAFNQVVEENEELTAEIVMLGKLNAALDEQLTRQLQINAEEAKSQHEGTETIQL